MNKEIPTKLVNIMLERVESEDVKDPKMEEYIKNALDNFAEDAKGGIDKIRRRHTHATVVAILYLARVRAMQTTGESFMSSELAILDEILGNIPLKLPDGKICKRLWTSVERNV